MDCQWQVLNLLLSWMKTSRSQGPLLYCMQRHSWKPTFLKMMELTSKPLFPPTHRPPKSWSMINVSGFFGSPWWSWRCHVQEVICHTVLYGWIFLLRWYEVSETWWPYKFQWINYSPVSGNPQTFHQALLITNLARLAPESVLYNIMPIFTFMGSDGFHHDDSYSFKVIKQVWFTSPPPGQHSLIYYFYLLKTIDRIVLVIVSPLKGLILSLSQPIPCCKRIPSGLHWCSKPYPSS